MKVVIIFRSRRVLFFFLFVIFGVIGNAEVKNIIQKQKISFEKCIEVIKTSSDRLSISPVIINKSVDVRIAEFVMSDGKLSITCDREKKEIVVTRQ